MIIGIGVDICQVDRVAAMLERHPGLMDRLFNSAESHTADGRPRSADSLAARFCAKEALAKALGSPGGMSWLDAEVITSANGAPSSSFAVRLRREPPNAQCRTSGYH